MSEGPISGRRRSKAPVYYQDPSSETDSGEEDVSPDDNQSADSGKFVDYDEEEEAGQRIQQILGVKESDSAQDEKFDSYYVKWADLSYIHCSWLSYDEVMSTPGGDIALRKFKKKTSDDDLSRSSSIPSLLTASQDDLNANWFHVERIIGKRDNQYFVKWKSLPYDQCTWENEEDIEDKNAIKSYLERSKHWNSTLLPNHETEAEETVSEIKKKLNNNDNDGGNGENENKDWNNKSEFVTLTEPLSDKLGNTLRPYQLEGLNWLRYCWYKKVNSILADEMGLGKTVQIVGVLNDIATNHHITGPFLIIAPLTTLPQWKNEFEKWTNLNAIIYHGGPTAREIIEEFEFPAYDENGNVIPNAVSFDSLITNYETFVSNFAKLKEIEWRYLVLDEGHRLKNHSGKCYQLLLQLTYDHCTLLTGTPIQNNVEELWSLLHLLHPRVFNDLPGFLERFGNIDNVETLQSLQKLIHPFLLRRKKNDVETSIAAKEETIIEVELTRIQKTYYRALLHENASTLLQQITGGSLPSLLNLMMQLRKVCNHPFLIKGARENIEEQIKNKMPPDTDPEDIELEALIDASGKMILIDKLLPKLQNDGHKVLIFSQMVKVLDIIEDYLIRKDLTFERIDGSVPENEREAAIERFGNNQDAFIFLLCTKAGGVGINLTAADTVIIFDSDWNPQNDVQAQSRCHRIGQKREVKVYRLVTRGTYELQMLDRASKKLGLDHALLDGGELNHSQPMAAKEIEKLLRHGAYDIAHDDDTNIDNFCAADIDQILELHTKKQKSDDSGTSLFNKAKFTPENDSIDLNAADFWSYILPSVSVNKEEPLARRRCRKDTPNIIDKDSSSDEDSAPEKAKKKISPVSIRGTIRKLLNFGLGESPYQKAILHQAAVMSELSPEKENCIKEILQIDDLNDTPEEIKNALEEFSSNLNDVRERKTSIVRRCILFHKLKPLIKRLQGNIKSWPSSDASDPMFDYALLLGIYEKGISEGPSILEGLSHDEPKLSSLKYIEKKLIQLIDSLDPLLDPLTSEQENVEILRPQEWKEAHPNLYNRSELNSEEFQSLFQTISYFGVPTKVNNDDNPKPNELSHSDSENAESSKKPNKEHDWEPVLSYTKLVCVSKEAIINAGEEIVSFANSEDITESTKSPLIEKLGPYGTKQWQRKLRNIIRDLEKIRAFKLALTNSDDDFLSKVKQFDAVDWWEVKHDIALINAISEFGQLLVTTWVADKDRPFREHISQDLLEEFDKAAEAEKQKGKQVKPKDTGDLAFIFKDKLRINRALLVVKYVESQREKAREKKTNSSYKSFSVPQHSSSKTFIIVKTGKFSVKDSVYPIGFTSRHFYYDAFQPEQNIWYESHVHSPVKFTIKMLSEPFRVFTGSSPDDVCNQLNQIIEEKISENPNLQQKTHNFLSGTSFFGFDDPSIQEIMNKQRNTAFPVPKIAPSSTSQIPSIKPIMPTVNPSSISTTIRPNTPNILPKISQLPSIQQSVPKAIPYPTSFQPPPIYPTQYPYQPIYPAQYQAYPILQIGVSQPVIKQDPGINISNRDQQFQPLIYRSNIENNTTLSHSPYINQENISIPSIKSPDRNKSQEKKAQIVHDVPFTRKFSNESIVHSTPSKPPSVDVPHKENNGIKLGMLLSTNSNNHSSQAVVVRTHKISVKNHDFRPHPEH